MAIVRFKLHVYLHPDSVAQHLLESLAPGNVHERFNLEAAVAQGIREYLGTTHVAAADHVGVTLEFDEVGVEREISLQRPPGESPWA